MNELTSNSRLTPPVGEEDHIAGPPTAAITLVAYCDFECPYCGEAFPLIKQLQAQLGENLRYVFRHFPLLDKHPNAEQAAEAAEAAGAQDQFWAMHDLLFENQEALEATDLYAYAESLAIDLEQFAEDFSGRRFATRVASNIRSGRRSGVTGTPTFFINGISHTNEETLERLALDLRERRAA